MTTYMNKEEMEKLGKKFFESLGDIEIVINLDSKKHNEVNVINRLNSTYLEDYLYSPEGEKIILNVISKDKNKLRDKLNGNRNR